MEPSKPSDRPMPRGAPAQPIPEPPRLSLSGAAAPKAKGAVAERPPEVSIQSSFRQLPTAPKPMEPGKPTAHVSSTGSTSGSVARSDGATPSPDRKAAPQPMSAVSGAVSLSSSSVSSPLATASRYDEDAEPEAPAPCAPVPTSSHSSPPSSSSHHRANGMGLQQPQETVTGLVAGPGLEGSEPAAGLSSPPAPVAQIRSVRSNLTPVRSVRVSSEEQAPPAEPRAR
jgi:hypothetical protein